MFTFLKEAGVEWKDAPKPEPRRSDRSEYLPEPEEETAVPPENFDLPPGAWEGAGWYAGAAVLLVGLDAAARRRGDTGTRGQSDRLTG